MITQELEQYIRMERAKGVPDESIKDALIRNGWSRWDVLEAMRDIAPPVTNVTMPAKHSDEPIKRRRMAPSRMSMAILIVLLIAGGVYLYLGGYLDKLLQNKNDSALNNTELNDNTIDGMTVDLAKNKDLSVEYYVSSLSAGLQTYFEENSNFEGFCKSSLVSKADFALLGAIDQKLTCREHAEGVIAYAPLMKGGYYCVDTKGYVGKDLIIEEGDLFCE